LSRKWLTEILRDELGYAGVVVSDDLDMKAVHERWSTREVVGRSLAAGADCFLACRDASVQAEAEAVLDENMARGEDGGRAAASLERLRQFRATLTKTPSGHWQSLPLDEHARLAARAK
jgi:beta-N-acetylhexosaminidase